MAGYFKSLISLTVSLIGSTSRSSTDFAATHNSRKIANPLNLDKVIETVISADSIEDLTLYLPKVCIQHLNSPTFDFSASLFNHLHKLLHLKQITVFVDAFSGLLDGGFPSSEMEWSINLGNRVIESKVRLEFFYLNGKRFFALN
jgi:hypothetical protein